MGYEANEIADSNFSLHLGEQTNREDVEFLSDRIKVNYKTIATFVIPT